MIATLLIAVTIYFVVSIVCFFFIFKVIESIRRVIDAGERRAIEMKHEISINSDMINSSKIEIAKIYGELKKIKETNNVK